MNATRLFFAVAAVALSGCTVPEESASERFAEAWCSQMRRCSRGEFDSRWDNRSECVDQAEELLDDTAAFYELLGCEYDARQAQRALSDLRGASCEEFEEGDAIDDPDVYVCR